ncbi:MAG: rhomboid family intramembrane serine protease [Pseudobdellovibrionaceae bacterium]|nr:rhomboid family intramembrane serine protease [Bdellovibrionales bacterium]USN47594.1 MAG: rhomboid family intramembrane serine protease [Pseudobdellovibrionaceae bacterium]
MFLHFQGDDDVREVLSKSLRDDTFIIAQGQFFAQYIGDHNIRYSPTMLEMARRGLAGDESTLMVLGGLALRHTEFVNEVASYPFKGDQVKVTWWRAKLAQLLDAQERMPSYNFGLRSGQLDGLRWISYQFIHGSFVHLAVNMIFLMIFGAMLEPIIGALGLLVLYLGAGTLAAGVFILLSGASSIPLIGASGSVSGLMSLFCFMFWNRPVRYVYMLFVPVKGYVGFIYLPAWITLVTWFLSDLAGYLGTLDEMGGIAYTAHLGGQAAGVVVGATVFVVRYFKNEKLLPLDKIPPTKPIGTRVI